MTAKEYAEGLRAVADWFEAHPEAPLPHQGIDVFTMENKEQAISIARWLGRCEKRWSGDLFYLGRDFGAVRLQFVALRSEVCERRVVGIKEVPEQIIAAHEEEVVEWDCHPLLAPDGAV